MKIKAIASAVFVLFVITLILIYYFMPFTELEFGVYTENYNFSVEGETLPSMQFYSNMRFESKHISYKIENCSIKKQEDMIDAFSLVEAQTPLHFYNVAQDEDILVTCDESARFSGGMFIAGEGGPTNIVKAGKYSVITHGKILLLRDSNCQTPNIALHELFHVLGFTHSDNPNNIMYNYTKCSQTIGQDIPKRLTELYNIPSHPDLILENASASMKSRYVNVNLSLRNVGLGQARPTMVAVRIGDSIVKEVEVEGLGVGEGKRVTMENIWVSSTNIEEIELLIHYAHEELDTTNNNLVLKIKK